MRIVICVKQVPDTADIKWTENNTLQRDGVESIVNPFDLYAIETALKMKDKYQDVTVCAISMGPEQAKDVLKKAVSMGCDEAALLCDKKFAAADTLATAKTLAAGIKKIYPDTDLIICGQYATDGDTAQTPPAVSNILNFAQVTYVKEITDYNSDSLKVRRETEDGNEIVSVKLPALISMLKCDYEPRRALISGYINAHNAEIKVYSCEDIGLSPEDVGMKGSPTYVSKAFRPEQTRAGEFIEPNNTNEAIDILKDKLNEYS